MQATFYTRTIYIKLSPGLSGAIFNRIGFRKERDLVYPAVDRPTAQPFHLGLIPVVILFFKFIITN